MAYNWTAFVDHSIDDGLRLRTFTGEAGSGAEYLADDGDSTVRLVPAEDPRSEDQLARWMLAAELNHPNLLKITRAGRTRIDGLPFVYRSSEIIEDRLADLLPERPLSTEEAKDVLSSIVPALSYLHEQGIAHRSLNVDSIVAAGGQAKLTVDNVSRDGSIPRDMRDLGATLVEVLARVRTKDASAVPATMPSPFRQIAIGCLQAEQGDRWDIARVADALANGVVEESMPPRQEVPIAPVQARVEPSEQSSAAKTWVWVGLALVVVLGLIFALRRDPPTTAPVAAQPAPVQERRTIPAPEPAPPHGAPRSAAASSGRWGVVAAAYRDFDLAQKRANLIAQKWPQFQAHVYPAKGQGSRHYVLLGSDLSKREAENLLRRARSMGLPRDTYVTRFTKP